MRAAGLLLAPFLAPVVAFTGAFPAGAFPEGAPWDAARGDGCAVCHFDAPAVTESGALALGGLPARAEAGATYRLTLRLAVAEMDRAGFLISAWRGGVEAGRFAPVDERTEAEGAKARSTRAGTRLRARGQAEWTLDWQAPERLDGPILFEIWANAANGDDSRLGDETHHRLVTLLP